MGARGCAHLLLLQLSLSFLLGSWWCLLLLVDLGELLRHLMILRLFLLVAFSKLVLGLLVVILTHGLIAGFLAFLWWDDLNGLVFVLRRAIVVIALLVVLRGSLLLGSWWSWSRLLGLLGLLCLQKLLLLLLLGESGLFGLSELLSLALSLGWRSSWGLLLLGLGSLLLGGLLLGSFLSSGLGLCGSLFFSELLLSSCGLDSLLLLLLFLFVLLLGRWSSVVVIATCLRVLGLIVEGIDSFSLLLLLTLVSALDLLEWKIVFARGSSEVNLLLLFLLSCWSWSRSRRWSLLLWWVNLLNDQLLLLFLWCWCNWRRSFLLRGLLLRRLLLLWLLLATGGSLAPLCLIEPSLRIIHLLIPNEKNVSVNLYDLPLVKCHHAEAIKG